MEETSTLEANSGPWDQKHSPPFFTPRKFILVSKTGRPISDTKTDEPIRQAFTHYLRHASNYKEDIPHL